MNLDVDLANDGWETDNRIVVVALQVLQKYIRNSALFLFRWKIFTIFEEECQGSHLDALIGVIDHLEDSLAEVDAEEICR